MEVALLTAGTVRHAKLQLDYSYQHLVLTGRMPFLSPNQQCQSTAMCQKWEAVVFLGYCTATSCRVKSARACLVSAADIHDVIPQTKQLTLRETLSLTRQLELTS